MELPITKTMKTITVDLPKEIDAQLVELGLVDDKVVSAWVTDAIKQKLSTEKQLRYLKARGAQGSREEFEKVLAKVPAVEPAIEDRW